MMSFPRQSRARVDDDEVPSSDRRRRLILLAQKLSGED